MPVRLLQLIGGLAAVATLALSGTAVAGNGGYGGYQGNNCDHYRPWSNWGHGWYGHDHGGRYWNGWGDGNGYFDGNSYDRGCSGGSSSVGAAVGAKGKVDRVMVAVKRLRPGSTCQHLTRSGRLTRPGSCSPTHWLRAQGTSAWHYRIRNALPAGHYRLHRQAIDAAGNRERTRMLHLWIR